MDMDACILEVGREFVISKCDKLPSSAWRRVCSGSPGAAASRGSAGQTVNVLPADGETREDDRWMSLFPRGSVSPSCLASVSAALADTEAILHTINPSADACFLCPRNQLIAATEALISAGCGVCLAGTDFFKITGKPVRAPTLHTGAWWRGSAGLGSLRLQVSSFFVELGPAVPRSPASCTAAMSLKASRGGVLVGGGPGGLERRVVVDLQPPQSLRGEPVGEASSNEGWEKLPEGDGFQVALELESEALEQWGVWLFAGQRFARITGPAVGCSASSIAATCCSSLATLRKLCPKADFHAEPPFQATVGEVLRRGCLQQMLDTGVVPYFDKDDATVGGSIHVEDGTIVHKLPSGSMQRWKIHEMKNNPFGGDDLSNQVRQPAEELSIGSTVQYWSTTVQRWVSATVLALNEDGTYRLDIKKRASRQFIKEAAGAEAGQEMPAAAEPAVPSGNARVHGHTSLKHEKVAAGKPGKRQRRARSSSAHPNKAKTKTRKKASTSSEKQSSSDSVSDRGSEESSSSETS